MPETQSLENRVAILEAGFAVLIKKFEDSEQTGGNDWIEKITGTFEGDAEFGEILRLGAEIRRADRAEDIGP